MSVRSARPDHSVTRAITAFSTTCSASQSSQRRTAASERSVSRTSIKDFYGAGQEDATRTTGWEFVNGEPPVLLGNNEGANPVEFLLHALAGCVTTTTVVHAAARGITVHRLSTELEGTIDLQGMLVGDRAAA